jgi:hypothetical protein
MTDAVMDEPSQHGPIEGTEPTVPTFPPGITGANFLSYEGACVRILQIIGGIDAEQITPDLVVQRALAFFTNVDFQTRQLHQALDEQNGVLMALAKLSGLKEGSLYTEMIDIFKEWKPTDSAA